MPVSICQDTIYHVQAGGARRQGKRRFMPVFSRQCRHFHIGYIRRIADDYIIPAVSQCAEQVRFDQVYPLRQAVSFTIDTRHFQCIRTDIRCIDSRSGKGQGTGDGNATAAGSQVQDARYFRGFDPG